MWYLNCINVLQELDVVILNSTAVKKPSNLSVDLFVLPKTL